MRERRAVSRGKARGPHRFRGKACGRTFDALPGLHRKECWLAFGASLAAVRQAPDRLAGIVEADETFMLESRKGERQPDRKTRQRGLAHERVPVLVAADRTGAPFSHALPDLNPTA